MLKEIEQSPHYFYQMVQQYKEAQVLFAAIELDVFSYLSEWTAVEEIAARTGYHQANLALFLKCLVSIGLLEKQANRFKNSPAVDFYLNKEQELYLGEYILFREKMTGLNRVVERVRKGPVQKIVEHNKGAEVYDFYQLAKLTINEMYCGRVQSFLKVCHFLFPDDAPLKILDLGGGPGILAIEFIRKYSQARAVVFEDSRVAELPRQLAEQRAVSSRLKVMSGDFTCDDIGSHYDLIIAGGVMDFAHDNLKQMTEKLAAALKPDGYLYLVSHSVNEDYTAPRESIVGWLSSHLDGLNILLDSKTLARALAAAGFKQLDKEGSEKIMANLQARVYIRG